MKMNQLVGYMSVRSKPSYEQIQAASAAYKLFREGKAGHLKIQNGKVVKSTFLGKLNPFKNLNIKTRFLMPCRSAVRIDADHRRHGSAWHGQGQ